MDSAEQMCVDFEEVGVRCELEVLGILLQRDRSRADKVMARSWMQFLTGEMYTYGFQTLPINPGGAWGSKWGTWYAAGRKVVEGAEEPPPEVVHLFDLYDGAKFTKDGPVNAAREIYKWIVDNQVEIGVIGGTGVFSAILIVNADLANFPETFANRGGLNSPSTAFPEQMWYRSAERRALVR